MALPFALASTTVSVAIIYLLYLVGLLTMTNWFTGLFATLFVFMLAHYLVPIVLLNYMPEQNLKEKYNAEWAVVTGGSSGIGASIVQRLANQGINVAIVALDDDLLKDFTKTMQLEFKELEFRAVGVNMSADGYLDEIIEQTKDINVSLVFNNAGYLMVGAFAKMDLDRQIGNLECNVMSFVKITHHFVGRMIEEKRKGAVSFTSSGSHLFPAPTCAMYASGKSFISTFAATLAVETYDYGIDVFAVIPSYTRTNLYKDSPKLDVLAFFGT
eukprot:TRINITY_DN719_c0_g1_i1.p1 TRINITY_DN719_c0_g1~~TRINITY_DN719_c0_g1_i1.p1  ORF type:complete len:278 (+),score=81.35 TRINITY_DN719_c0_g1_i1:24-836(+)